MTVTVVFIQGAGSGAHDEDLLLARSLGEHLGPDYAVEFPRMPEEDSDDAAWLDAIGEALDGATAPLALVGHSVGGYCLVKYLTERPAPPPVGVLCVIAAPFPSADPFWTIDGFDLPPDVGERLPKDTRVLLYASEDDEVVPFAHRDLYAAAIPQAVTRTTSGGHQLGDDLRVVADDIRALLG